MKPVFLLFLSGAVWVCCPQPDPVALPEAVRIALARHPDVGKARAGADVLTGKIREVRAQALPEITVTGGTMRMRDPSFLNSSSLDQFPSELVSALNPVGANMFFYGVNVRQPIYTAGKVATALRLARVEAEGALTDIDTAEQNVALGVVKAWYALLWAQEFRQSVEETQEQRRQHAAMARTRYQNGVATQVDVLRSEVAVENGKPELVRAENAIRQCRAQLNYYLGRAVDHETTVEGGFQEKTWDEQDLAKLTADAFRSRPELARLRTGERSAGLMVDLARAENRFRADFTSEYGIMSRLPKNLLNDRFLRWSVGVNFTLPLFDGFHRSGMVAQAVANQRIAKLEREKTEQQIALGLQQGLDDIQAAAETIAAARANIEQAERVLKMTQANYEYGAATTLDMMDAQTALTLARTNLLRGLYVWSVARAELRWAMGKTPWE
jgi:HAE1 family hydrophobic/amphiphilic exporter-1